MPTAGKMISASIITFNEEKNIQRCLASLAFVDEIVVIDSFSKDQTVELAKAAGAKVVQQAFRGHKEQKQDALNLCSHPWVLCLDADEFVTPWMRASIEQAFAELQPEIQGFSFNRISFHLFRWIRHGGWYPDKKLRLVQKKHAHWGGINPHDQLIVSGKTKHLKGNIGHYVFRDLSHNVEQNNKYSSISAKILAGQNKKFRLFHLLVKPPTTFIRLYFLRLGFLDGMAGFIIAVGAFYSQFLKYAKLWELEHQAKAESTDQA